MIEFHTGNGPDSQAIAIALEEMFLDYVIAPGRVPVPLTIVGHARLPGANNILMALARKTGRFLPERAGAAPWLSGSPPGLAQLEGGLVSRDFILGAYTIVDMLAYPLFVQGGYGLSAGPCTTAWAARMSLRPAVGRGMAAVG